MEYAEFLKRVQSEAGLDSAGQAERIVEAALSTLGERIHHTERDHLAAELSGPLKSRLNSRATVAVERIPLESFYARVAARSGLRYAEAVRRTLAVMKVLRQAVSPGELKDVLAGLPDEYRELFGEKPPGPGSPTAV